tara:strand:- start:363 stop:863 length:501 start_codon:yes stop_codon:yes gene_type:complete
MNRLLLLFVPLIFFCCETQDDDNTANSPTGYNCTTSGCLEDWTGNAQYATLDECVSVCPIDCSCGTVIDTTHYPGSDGTITPVFDAQGNVLNWTLEGAYEEVIVCHVENYCSGNIGTNCSGADIGEESCMEYQTNLFLDTFLIEVINGNVITTPVAAICLSTGLFE